MDKQAPAGTEQGLAPLFITDLPADICAEDLMALFPETRGSVTRLKLERNRKNNQGDVISWASVTFQDYESAQKTLSALNSAEIAGNRIRAFWDDIVDPECTYTVIIKNLSLDMTEQDLRQLLEQFGELLSVTFAAGTRCGYALAGFEQKAEAMEVVDHPDFFDEAPGLQVKIEYLEEPFLNVVMTNLPAHVKDAQSLFDLLVQLYPKLPDKMNSAPRSPQPAFHSQKKKGFCLMKDSQSALELFAAVDGADVAGKTLIASVFKPIPPEVVNYPCPERNIFIRGFDDAADLNELFKKFGRITCCTVDRAGKNHAFVNYAHPKEAARAVLYSTLIKFAGSQCYCAIARGMKDRVPERPARRELKHEILTRYGQRDDVLMLVDKLSGDQCRALIEHREVFVKWVRNGRSMASPLYVLPKVEIEKPKEFFSKWGVVSDVKACCGGLYLAVTFEEQESADEAREELLQCEGIQVADSEIQFPLVEVVGLPLEFEASNCKLFHLPEPLKVAKDEKCFYLLFENSETADLAVKAFRHAIVNNVVISARRVCDGSVQNNVMVIRKMRPNTRAFDIEAWALELGFDGIWDVRLIEGDIPSGAILFYDQNYLERAKCAVRRLETRLVFKFPDQ